MINTKQKIKYIVSFAFLLLISIGTSAAYFLSQQTQDIRQQAWIDQAYDCTDTQELVDGVCRKVVVTPTLTSDPDDRPTGNECTINANCAGLGSKATCEDGFCISNNVAQEPEYSREKFPSQDDCKLKCDGICEGENGDICVTEIIDIDVTIDDFIRVEEEEEDDLKPSSSKRCTSSGNCDDGEVCTTSPFGSFCVNVEDAGGPDSSVIVENNDDLFITMNDYDKCVENSSPADCKIILSHVGEREPELVIETETPEEECTDTWCRGSNLENLEERVEEEIDEVRITESDYDRCVRENSPSECSAILNNIGEIEPCSGLGCLLDDNSSNNNVATNNNEATSYEECIASGKTGIECESKIAKVTLETEYESSLNDCEINNVGFDVEACKHIVTTTFNEDSKIESSGTRILEGTTQAVYDFWVEQYGEETANAYLKAITNQDGYGYKPSSFLGIEGFGDFGNYISSCQEGDSECLAAAASFGAPAIITGGVVSGGLAATGVSVVPHIYTAVEIADTAYTSMLCTMGDLAACASVGIEAALPIFAKPLTKWAGNAVSYFDDVTGWSSLKNLPGNSIDEIGGWTLGTYGNQTNYSVFNEMGQEIMFKRELGRGGFGSVYEAGDSVIKILNDPRNIDMEVAHLRRMETALIDGGGTQYLGDISRVDGVVTGGIGSGIQMDLIDGQAISWKNGQPTGTLSADNVATLRGIAAAWDESGWLHKDLSPANIIKKPDGSIVVIDPAFIAPSTPYLRGSSTSTNLNFDFYSDRLEVSLKELTQGIDVTHNINGTNFNASSPYLMFEGDKLPVMKTYGRDNLNTNAAAVESLLDIFPELNADNVPVNTDLLRTEIDILDDLTDDAFWDR